MHLEGPLIPSELHGSSEYVSLVEAAAALMVGKVNCAADSPALAEVTQLCHLEVIGISILFIFQEIRETCNLL